MKNLLDYITYIALAVVLLIVCAAFVYIAWNGFIVPEFRMPHMSFLSSIGATLLWWMVYGSLLSLKELGNT